MTDLSARSIAVIDSGLFVHVAQCLAKAFGRVYYFSPCSDLMPKISRHIVGDGFENIERIDEPESVIGKADAWAFCDIGAGDFQKYLTSIGEHVFGHHGGDVLEYDKEVFYRTLAEVGLEVPPHEKVQGIDNLRALLRDAEDKYVKVSKYRGDLETMHFRSWTLDEGALDCLAYRLGPLKNKFTFFVLDAIPADVETGMDSWFIGGWPKKVFHALEHKDKSLIGGMQDFAEVAEPVREINEAFAPVLSEYGYQGPFSTEVRIGEKPYFTDATCRFASPVSQIQTALITNLPEVIWGGAHGELIEPEYDHAFGAQVLITSDREESEWLTFDMPDELRPHIKASFSCEIDGILTIAPNPLVNWAGWLVSTGPTIQVVVDTLKERKEMLPDGFECDLSSLVDLLRELEDAKEQGVEITKQEIPAPESVLATGK